MASTCCEALIKQYLPHSILHLSRGWLRRSHGTFHALIRSPQALQTSAKVCIHKSRNPLALLMGSYSYVCKSCVSCHEVYKNELFHANSNLCTCPFHPVHSWRPLLRQRSMFQRYILLKVMYTTFLPSNVLYCIWSYMCTCIWWLLICDV